MNVVESVGDIGCDLHSRNPVRSLPAVRALDVLVDKVDVAIGA